MTQEIIYTFASVILVSLISLIGVVTLAFKPSLLKKCLICFVSFSAGALLGDVFIHLLPEIVEKNGFGLSISLYILFGIVFSFILEKVIHWRHCHHPTSKEHPHPFAIMNLVGDFFHNFLDGLIIGASYLASIPVGIATTIAVILHEIPQEIGDFGVLLHGGYSKGKALFLNFVIALTAILGAIVAVVLVGRVENALIFLVPFAAGNFLYIASADLIPELHKYEFSTTGSVFQLFMMVLGMGVMAALMVVG
jgi:zinc and cadmium transporter